MKKLFAALIALAIIVSMIPTAVFANEQQTTDLSADAQVVQTGNSVENATGADATYPVEEPLFDGGSSSDCICGGKHENKDHDCAAVTWTGLSNANVDTYFKAVKIEGTVNLRLSENVTAKNPYYISEGAALNLDLNGHTLTIDNGSGGLRALNVYAGATLNICDSSTAGTGKLVTSRNPGTASIIACFGAPTAEKPTKVNLWGGTFTNTGSPSVPAILCNTNHTHFTMYEGAVIENCKNNYTELGVASGIIVFGAGATGNGTTGVFNGGTIRNCTLKCNGGAIVAFNGEITINDILIDGIDIGTKNGAGMYLASLATGGVYKNMPTVTMKGGKITNCKAGNGGGIYIQDGMFTMDGGAITGNTATGLLASNGTNNSYGGGIYYKPTNRLADSGCVLNGGEISNNTCSSSGGGIRINSNGCLINGVKITGNTSQAADGGGVYLTNNATANMTAGEISGNHCGGPTTNYQASGVGMRSGTTFNVSGNSRIFNNTGVDNCPVNLNFGYAGGGLRTINIGELTDNGYIVLDLGASEKMTLTESDANNIDASTAGIKIYSVKHETPLEEGDVELKAVIATEQYLGGMTYPIEIQARLTQQAAISEAYLAEFKASAASAHTAAAETEMQASSVKLTKNEWTKVGELTADIDTIFETYDNEAVTVTAKITAAATDATEFEAECTGSVNIKFDPDAHMHCICGKKDGCVYGDHETTNIIYKKITQANVSELNGKAFNGPKEYCFYLDEDITITNNIVIGNKSGVAVNFYLCLNGHTITTTGNRLIDMRNGTCTICDCKGGGTIQAKITSATPASGCIFFWQGTSYAAGSPTLTMYGGTLTYADDTAKTSSYGLVCTQGNAVCNLRGVTVDGKNKANTPNQDGGGSGGLSALQGTMNLEDCTIKNCVSVYSEAAGTKISGCGGGLNVFSTAECSVKNCTFENCKADLNGGAIYAAGAKDLTLSGEIDFTGNTANGEANDIALKGNRQLVLENFSSNEKVRVRIPEPGTFGTVSAADYDKLIITTGDPNLDAEYVNGKLVVSKYTTDHPHCYCGGNCEVGNHSHVTKTKWVECSDASQLSGVTITSETWYYLTKDITISKDITIKDDAILRICLNGHKITTTASRMFNYYEGTVSICDCKGTGALLANQTTASDGALVFCQSQSAAHKGGTFELYGGKMAYASKNAPAANQGLFYGTSNGAYDGLTINMYGGTIDGTNNAQSINAGCIYLYRGTMNMYGGVIKNGNTKNYGGAVRLASTSFFNMYGGELSNNKALGGGAIYAAGSGSVTIYDGVIKNNEGGTSGGGAIWINSGNASLYVHGGQFTNNVTKTGKSGGTFRVGGSASKSTKFVMTDGVVKGGRAGFSANEGYGGAVWISNATFIMKGGLITDCRAYSMGGGVYGGSKTTTIRIEGGTISNCIAYNQGGGGICCNRAHLVMTGGVIENNIAKNWYNYKQGGGGILMMWDNGGSATNYQYFNDWSTAQLLGGIIRNNTSENRQGGGMYAKHCKVTMDGVVFEGNYGEGDGGGGYSAGNTTYTYIKNATFRENEALKAGGGLVINGGSFLDVDYAVFENNYAGTNGGGMMLFNVEAAHIKDVLIAGNYSKSGGGGLYLRSRYQGATIDHMTLRDNSGSSGGGAYFYNDVKIKDCKIFNNEARTGAGGGICTSGPSNFEMLGGLVENNKSATNGGGIYMVGHATIENTIIQNNTATNGGGIFNKKQGARWDTYLTLGEGTLVRNNTASEAGGGLYNRDVYNHLTIDGAEIYGNKAGTEGGGIYNRFEAYLTINSGKIHDNEAGTDGGAIRGQGRIELYGGEIYNNKAKGIGGACYFSDEDNDTESYQHNVFIFGGVKIHDNKGKVTNGVYLTETAAGLIQDGILMHDALFDITLSSKNDITKTLQGAYNYQKLGNNTYRITDASNALRPSEIDKDGKVIFVGEVVSVEEVKAAQAEQERIRQQQKQEREEDDNLEEDEAIILDDNISLDDFTTVGTAGV